SWLSALCRLLPRQFLVQRFQQLARAGLALTDIVVAVEICALLGEDQARAGALLPELHGRLRGGDWIAVDGHPIGDDDPLVRHDVLENGVVGDRPAALEAEAAAFEAADAEVGFEHFDLPAFALGEPAALG